MKSAELFLDFFAHIENHLKKVLGVHNHERFNELVIKVAENNHLVRNYKEQLLSLGNLRNAIVHETRKDFKVIADPREDMLELIQEIYIKITKPKFVLDFFNVNVYSTTPNSDLAIVLEQMVTNDFSQAPILEDGKIIGLLNKESIANWMGRNVADGEPDFLLSDTKVKTLISSGLPKGNYKIIPRTINLVEARDLFLEKLGSIVPLEVLLITQNGKPNESLLGIITRNEDLGVIIKNI